MGNEPLRYDRQEEMESVDARELAFAEEGATKPKKGVRFQETVTVVSIPMRNDYSGRNRARQFSDVVEMWVEFFVLILRRFIHGLRNSTGRNLVELGFSLGVIVLMFS